MPWADDQLKWWIYVFQDLQLRSDLLIYRWLICLVGSDGIVDGVFKFSRILETSYLWCPPFKTGKLDLSLFKK